MTGLLESTTAVASGTGHEPGPHRESDVGRGPLLALTIAATVSLAAVAVAVVARTGTAPFTLDDPLIHVRVAQQISRGTYGINLGEPASPSSSAIWPFLFAPFGRTGLVVWVPLAITAACTVISVRLVYLVLRAGWVSIDPRGALTAVMAGLVALGTGLGAVAFMGLEHALQIALTLAVALGVARRADGNELARSTLVSMAVLPIVRYEGLLVAAAAAAALFVLGERRRPLRALGAGICGVLGFAGFLVLLGRSPIPSSVLAKAASKRSGTGPMGLVDHVADNWDVAWQLTYPTLLALVLVGVMLMLTVAVRRRVVVQRELALLAMAFAVLAGHLTVFGHDSYWRYEAYAMVLAVVAVVAAIPTIARAASPEWREVHVRVPLLAGSLAVLVVAFGPGAAGLVTISVAAGVLAMAGLAAAVRWPRPASMVVLAVLVTLAAAAPMLVRTLAVPSDARAIYQQQYQAHRLVRLLDEPVAANDIGWVSVDAEHRVLDLWGLASEDARRARLEGDPGWMDALLEAEAVDVAIIYDPWFDGEVPATWVRVGTLRASEQGMTAHPEVAVYGRNPAAADRAGGALRELGRTAPVGVSIELA